MSRLLSQDEVDALLSSMEVDAPVNLSDDELVYDLRAPLVLAGERLALVTAACEKLAKPIAEAVTAILIAEKHVRASFTGITQQPASTLLGTLAPGEPVGVLVDEAGHTTGGFCFQSQMGLSIIDRLLGGTGEDNAGPRALSPVEMNLLQAAHERMSGFLSRHTALGHIQIDGLDRDPVFGKLASRGGMLAAASFRIESECGDADFRLLMTPTLAARLASEPSAKTEESPPQNLLESVSKITISVEPVVTGASIRLRDLMMLRPGQVLQLDVREQAGLALRFNEALLASGSLSRSQGERMFEVTEVGPSGRGMLEGGSDEG